MTCKTTTIGGYEYRRDEVLAGWYQRRRVAPTSDRELLAQIERIGLAGQVGDAANWVDVAPGSLSLLPRAVQRAIAKL